MVVVDFYKSRLTTYKNRNLWSAVPNFYRLKAEIDMGADFRKTGLWTTCMIDLVLVCYIYLNDLDVTY
jgi:hypothetical protein